MLDQFLLLAQTTLGDGSATASDWRSGFWNVFLFLIALGVPFLLGQGLGRWLKMPTYIGAFTVILFFVLGTALVLLLPTFDPSAPVIRYGPDIAGGTNLIYEIDRSSEDKNAARRVVSRDFLVPLMKRLNPSGTLEINIRPNGDDRIEITVPAVDDSQIADLERLITEAGILEFRIVANRNDHKDIIDRAVQQANSDDQNIRVRKNVVLADKTSGEERVAGVWRQLVLEETRPGVFQYEGYEAGDIIRNGSTGRLIEAPPSNRPGEFASWVRSQGIERVEILLALQRGGKPFTVVSGIDLERAQKSFGKMGGYEVSFTMSGPGSSKMLSLTSANLPNKNNDFKRRMAILLDGNVQSAPNLNDAISSSGVIQGNFTEKDVQRIVDILNAGALPGVLNKVPVSKNVIGANMGQDAIYKGGWASIVSLIVTMVLVIMYYRFSGLVAVLALLLNLAMILAVMILIRQPLTLSGIAGLVLSVGMSVDANVLVFERIREEMEKKATPRLAIRNGFDRAWTTIFDSNLTTLITAIVLYWVGTEQIKGFAVTLIIGLAISLFTAVFVSHKLFEVCEKTRFLSLGMADYVNSAKRALFGPADVDFMSYRFACYAGSLVLIAIGLIATFLRGSQILDIDFNGGTSIVFSLDKGLPADEVRTVVQKAFDKDQDDLPIQSSLINVEMKDAEKNSVYKLDVSLKDQSEVASRLLKGFSEESGARLVTYDVDYSISNPQSALGFSSPAKLVSLQEAKTEETATKPTDVTSPTNAEVKSKVDLSFHKSSEGAGKAKINAKQLRDALSAAATAAGFTLVDAQIELYPKGLENWTPDSSLGAEEWTVTIPFNAADTNTIGSKLKDQIRTQPVWQSISKIEASVASEMQQRAWAGLALSLIFIVAYIWFRFQNLAYGIAAVVALIHDVLITLAFIAVSHWLFRPLGFLQIEDFKISLTIVAAFLTIIGYSLNDTIVVFDRIREVKGKSPRLTKEMINSSVTQTLSRTLLTSSTTIVAILLMYFFGGEGIHGFAYCLLIGILVGTYSSIFIAAPILLWIVERQQAAKAKSSRRVASAHQ
jgi:SecD/SecF fusion protein